MAGIFSSLKTSVASYFPLISGNPAWKLNFSGNVWDRLMDILASIFSSPGSVTLYNFTAQAPGGTLTASTPATITLSPVPLGVNGTDANHYLYVSGGTGTAERVLITGGTAVAGATSGTITFTPANNHSGAWTIAGGSLGIQEAIVNLGVNGGYVDATGLTGAQSILSTITIPKGVTVLLGAGTFTGAVLPVFMLADDDSGIIGRGRKTTLIRGTGSSGAIVKAQKSSGTVAIRKIRLKDLSIDGTGTTGSVVGHLGVAAWEADYNNVRFDLCPSDGCQLTDGTSLGAYYIHFTDCMFGEVSGAASGNGGAGLHLNPGGGGGNMTVVQLDNCNAGHNAGPDFYLHGVSGGVCDWVTFNNCNTQTKANVDACKLDRTNSIVFNNCDFETSAGTGYVLNFVATNDTIFWNGGSRNAAGAGDWNSLANVTNFQDNQYIGHPTLLSGTTNPGPVLNNAGWTTKMRWVAQGNVFEIANNCVSISGTQVNLDDTSNHGMLLHVTGLTVEFWWAAAGANPRTVTKVAIFDQAGGIALPSLPSASPGAGSKKLWYDAADSNRVKFAP